MRLTHAEGVMVGRDIAKVDRGTLRRDGHMEEGVTLTVAHMHTGLY